MARPVWKDPAVEQALEAVFGRTTAITSGVCVVCGKSADQFREEISRREYAISGLCQYCQDAAFAPLGDEQ